MANINNLKPFNTMDAERQREIARQGGIASGKSRLRKKLLKAHLQLVSEEMEEQKQPKKEIRKAFRKNDLKRFEQKALEYLDIEEERKSVNDFCNYIGITRFTLSKYRKRGIQWQHSIDNIKKVIQAFNCEKQIIREYERLIIYAKKLNNQS